MALTRAKGAEDGKGWEIYKLSFWFLIVTTNSKKAIVLKCSKMLLIAYLYALACQSNKLISYKDYVTIQKINQ